MITSDQIRDKVYTIIMEEPLYKEWFKCREDSKGNNEFYGELYPENFHNWIKITFQVDAGLSFSIMVNTPNGVCSVELTSDQSINFMNKLYSFINFTIKENNRKLEESQQGIYESFLNYTKTIEGNK